MMDKKKTQKKNSHENKKAKYGESWAEMAQSDDYLALSNIVWCPGAPFFEQ
jgi:hypothetical protein